MCLSLCTAYSDKQIHSMVSGRNWESLEMFKEHCLKLKRGMSSKIIVKSSACFHVEDYSCQKEAIGAVFVLRWYQLQGHSSHPFLETHNWVMLFGA